MSSKRLPLAAKFGFTVGILLLVTIGFPLVSAPREALQFLWALPGEDLPGVRFTAICLMVYAAGVLGLGLFLVTHPLVTWMRNKDPRDRT